MEAQASMGGKAMKPEQCTYEEAVARAAQSGDWTPALRAHAAECTTCSEVALVSGFLQAEAEAARAEALLPDPGHIWRKAQLASIQAAAERALRPIAMMEKLTVACGALVLGAVFLWNWPRLTAWLGRANVLGTPKMPAGAPMNLPFLVATALLLLLPVLLFGLYVSWSEE
jgi:hypothetical protein